MSRKLLSLGIIILFASRVCTADPLPIIDKVAAQPLLAQVKQLEAAMEDLGSPLPERVKAAIAEAGKGGDDAKVVRAIQESLDPLCLFGVEINPESRVKVVAGAAEARLVEQGWRSFLVKVHNEAGVTAELKARSESALPMANSPKELVGDRWLELQMFNGRPMNRTLSGLEVEYRIISLYSRDEGKRSATLSFNVGQGTQDAGFRGEMGVMFDAEPSTKLTLGVRDEESKPTTAAFVIRDRQGRVYPSQAKRLAPDFAFHPQVYRSDGEIIRLPSGVYTFDVTRGPESIAETRMVTVGNETGKVEFQVKRWIDPAKLGWWSGDHHIHAAGCAHYIKPTEGVLASDMIRHCLGEDLKVGCNLTWGPCFDYQKQFFTGQIDKVSQYPYLLRYDIEVSGFGSHRSGHLCLLRLKDEMYPGGDSDKHWPTLCLNTLKWAKKQGAVCGPAHSGWGLDVRDKELPNYTVPPYSGIGANEYVVDVTHTVAGPDGREIPAVDFMSTVDTPYVWELNMWYHTLNCGFRTRASGETDFPCIYGERVGIGRSYVKLGEHLDFDAWCEGIREGRSYVSEGRSHLLEFAVNDVHVGDAGSEVRLAAPGKVHVTAKAAALLPEKATGDIASRPYQQAPYWHIERARIGDSRKVMVEVIVNGYPVAKQELQADGTLNDLGFDVNLERSSWVAMRVLPSSHTNPVFVLVGDKPIRASKRSAAWCLKGVDQCWSQKQRFIAPGEMEEAKRAYEHARVAYRGILGECEAE